jgi:hypothetical protein
MKWLCNHSLFHTQIIFRINIAIPSEGTPACWVEGFVCLSEAAGYAGNIARALLADKLP